MLGQRLKLYWPEHRGLWREWTGQRQTRRCPHQWGGRECVREACVQQLENLMLLLEPQDHRDERMKASRRYYQKPKARKRNWWQNGGKNSCANSIITGEGVSVCLLPLLCNHPGLIAGGCGSGGSAAGVCAAAGSDSRATGLGAHSEADLQLSERLPGCTGLVECCLLSKTGAGEVGPRPPWSRWCFWLSF